MSGNHLRELTVRTIREEPGTTDVPVLEHPGWRERYPWLVQGVTGRGPEDRPFDLAFFGKEGGGERVWERWRSLARAVGIDRVVHGRQVHGPRVVLHREGPPGVFLAPECDGHVTASPSVLLTVALADCVPVYLVEPDRRAVALLHAGWRGTAAGVLERGVGSLRDRLGVEPDDLHLHLGPAICGDCYEVGPEVHRALGLPDPGEPTPVDLREVVAARARSLGVPEDASTTSSWCTRCGDSPFFSHRGGDRGRQVGLLGIRPPEHGS